MNPEDKKLIKFHFYNGSVLKLKPMCLSDLAILYGVSRPTIRLWLKPIADKIGTRIGYKYNVRQVEIIFNHLSLPDELDALKKVG